VLIPFPDFLDIHYGEEGALVTAWQEAGDGSVMPIGRATVRNGVARLDVIASPAPGRPISLFATKPNAIGRAFSVNATR